MYNKRKFNKINDKKVLHKVKKQWVTISLALLMMVGSGAVAAHVSVNADATNQNHQSVNVKLNAKPGNKQTVTNRAKAVHTRLLAKSAVKNNAPRGPKAVNEQNIYINHKPATRINNVNQLRINQAGINRGTVYSRVSVPFNQIRVNRRVLLHSNIPSVGSGRAAVGALNQGKVVKVLKAFKLYYGDDSFLRYEVPLNNKRSAFITSNHKYVSYVVPTANYRNRINHILNHAHSKQFNKIKASFTKLAKRRNGSYRTYAGLYAEAYNTQQALRHPVVISYGEASNHHHVNHVASDLNNSESNLDLVHQLEILRIGSNTTSVGGFSSSYVSPDMSVASSFVPTSVAPVSVSVAPSSSSASSVSSSIIVAPSSASSSNSSSISVAPSSTSAVPSYVPSSVAPSSVSSVSSSAKPVAPSSVKSSTASSSSVQPSSKASSASSSVTSSNSSSASQPASKSSASSKASVSVSSINSYSGTYRYNSANGSLEFINGTLTWNAQAPFLGIIRHNGSSNSDCQPTIDGSHGKIDPSKVTSVKFDPDVKFTSGDKTAGLRNTQRMFLDLPSLQSVTLPNTFDTRDVTDMSGMFMSDNDLQSLTLPESFNTRNVTDMSSMFANDHQLQSLTLPNAFDTRNVTDMSSMFMSDTHLQSLTLPASFNTQNVTDMNHMFNQDNDLQALTLPETFDTGNVTNMNGMFSWDTQLQSLTLPESFNTSKVTDMGRMFDSVSKLRSLTLPKAFDTSHANTVYMFNATPLQSLILESNNAKFSAASGLSSTCNVIHQAR